MVIQQTTRFKKVTGNKIARKQSATVHTNSAGRDGRRATLCRCPLYHRERPVLPEELCIRLVAASGGALRGVAVQGVTRVVGGNGCCHGAIPVPFPPLGHRLHGLAFLLIQLSRRPHRRTAWHCFQPLAEVVQGAGRVCVGGRHRSEFGGFYHHGHMRRFAHEGPIESPRVS